jgi:limonene-1,2-epoxide hydrolase
MTDTPMLAAEATALQDGRAQTPVQVVLQGGASALRNSTGEVSGVASAAPVAGQALVATSATEYAWGANDSIQLPKIQPNGSTASDVVINTDASTTLLAVSLASAGLAISKIYQAVVSIRAVIWETALPSLLGSIDLDLDLTVSTNTAGVVFCSFGAINPDVSRLVGTPLAGATITAIASTNGFTIKITRPAAVACTARCSWTTNYFEAIAVNPNYPQAGTWTTGGIWDADHGIGGTPSAVTSITSLEGTAVLTTSGGTFVTATDSLTNTTVLLGDGTAVMSEINARWAAFGGLHTPFIAFFQVTVPTSATGTALVLSDAAHGHRTFQMLYVSAVVLGVYRVQGGLIVQTSVIAGNVRKTVVVVLHSDGNYYLIDDAGTTAPASDATIGSLVVDRMTLGTNSKFRRWGAKTPATANPLLEAQQLYSQLAVMS